MKCFVLHSDLSENLTWIRRYHAKEHQTLTSRLWRTIHMGMSSKHETSGAVANLFFSASGNRKTSIREQQHQDILMALSERELERQQELFQEHQQQSTNSSPSCSDKASKLNSKQHEDGDIFSNESPAESRSRSSSMVSLRRPSDATLGASQLKIIIAPQQHTSHSNSVSNNNDLKEYQGMSPRLLPPMITTILTGGSLSNDTAPPHEHSVARVSCSAQKYGRGHGGQTTESLYHPPGALLAYRR